jgi:hypothetical protein
MPRELSGLPAMADDSGLEVDALDGAPGVWSARYAGPGASDAANIAKLLRALHGVPPAARRARFRCVIAFVQSARILRRCSAPACGKGASSRRRAAPAASATTRSSRMRRRGRRSGRTDARRQELPQPSRAGAARTAVGARGNGRPSIGPTNARCRRSRCTCTFPVVRAQVPVLRFQFARAAGRSLPEARYVDALLADLDAQLARRLRAAAAPITSVCSSAAARRACSRPRRSPGCSTRRARAAFAADAEITLEANPGTIERGRSRLSRRRHQSRVARRAELRRRAAAARSAASTRRRNAPRRRGTARRRPRRTSTST